VKTAIRIIEHHFDDFINKRYDKLRQRYHLQPEQFEAVLHILRRLNPRPGTGINDTAGDAQGIIPDFSVTQEDDGHFEVVLNQGEVPALRISRSFSELLAEFENNKKNLSSEKKNTALYVKQKVESAKNFIKAIEQRRDTLLRTMTAIVNLQREFFEDGDSVMLKPMILEDVARETGLDKSTISRVTKNKYVQTEFGIFPLKFFFNERFITKDGEELAKMKIMNKLQEIIDGEDKRHPYSDDEITDLLNEAGLSVARRTVAKYRVKMKIPVARLRKQ
jgi:RNA polymerase sigma-54 factor